MRDRMEEWLRRLKELLDNEDDSEMIEAILAELSEPTVAAAPGAPLGSYREGQRVSYTDGGRWVVGVVRRARPWAVLVQARTYDDFVMRVDASGSLTAVSDAARIDPYVGN